MSKKLTKFKETFLIENNNIPFKESNTQVKALLPKIEAIHAGITDNYVRYTAEELSGDFDRKTGVFSWTHPFPKPVLTHHNQYGEPLGRVIDAKFSADSISGKSCITLFPAITDPSAIEKILDNRYLTVSIGCSAKAAYCSICGANVAEEWCDHRRGSKYEVEGKEEVCYWTLEDIEFYEVSFVNRPGDKNAMVVSTEWVAFDGSEFLDQENNHFGLEEMSNRGFNDKVLFHELFKDDTEGGNKVKLEELKVELDKVNEQLNLANKKIESIESSNTALVTEKEQLTDKVTKMTEEKEQLTDKVTKMTEEKEQLEKDTEEAKKAQATLNEEINSVKEEMSSLVEENTKTFAELQSAIVGYAAVIKKFVENKTDEDMKEIETELKTRSLESLQDTMKDLLESLVSIRKERNHIENPGLSGSSRSDTNEDLTDEDIVYSLLVGKK